MLVIPEMRSSLCYDVVSRHTCRRIADKRNKSTFLVPYLEYLPTEHDIYSVLFMILLLIWIPTNHIHTSSRLGMLEKPSRRTKYFTQWVDEQTISILLITTEYFRLGAALRAERRPS